jgi:hypothetical protein
MIRLRVLAGVFRLPAVGLTLVVGTAAWIYGGAAWAALFDLPFASSASARPAPTPDAAKSTTVHRHAAVHRGHRHPRHLARHQSHHAGGFAAHLHGYQPPAASDQESADEAPKEIIGALVPEWVATPRDGISAALAAAPGHGFDLVEEFNRAVGEISAVGTVPTETLKSFNDFPPDDAITQSLASGRR